MKRIVISLFAVFAVLSCAEEARIKLCEPYQIPGLAPAPEFWKVRPSQVIDLCENVKVGKTEIIAQTPAGQPVYT